MAWSILLVGVSEKYKIMMLNFILGKVKNYISDCQEILLFVELVFQFNELFGFVDIDLGFLIVEDNMVYIDASLVKVIYEKLKEFLMVNGRIVIKNFCIYFVILFFSKI